MTIRDILDKVDLNDTSTQSEVGQAKEATSMIRVSAPTKLQLSSSNGKRPNPTAAYLGPKLWENPISISSIGLEAEDEFEDEEDENVNEIMNMEDFLAENNIKFDLAEEDRSPNQIVIEVPVFPSSPISESPEASPPSSDIKPPRQQRPSIIISPKRSPKLEQQSEVQTKVENTFLYAESKRAKLEREKEERRKKLEVELEFAPEDLALATVPGLDFDPKQRTFDLDELRPQPIIKKRQKNFVPDQSKDDKYWDKREKNNVAARRSREARRLKENQIALRAAFLERENKVLKKELDDSNFDNTKLATERDILKKKLSSYETFALHKYRNKGEISTIWGPD